LYGRTLRNVYVPHVQPLVAVGDLLAVRGTHGRIEERRRVTPVYLLRVAEPALIADFEVVFARRLREVGHPLPVRRPRGIPLRDRRRARQVPDIPFVGRHREDLAPRLHHGALSGRRDTEVTNALGIHLHEVRPYLRQVPRHAHVDRPGLLRLQVVQLQRSDLLDHDRSRPRRRRLEVQTVVLDDLADLL